MDFCEIKFASLRQDRRTAIFLRLHLGVLVNGRGNSTIITCGLCCSVKLTSFLAFRSKKGKSNETRIELFKNCQLVDFSSNFWHLPFLDRNAKKLVSRVY